MVRLPDYSCKCLDQLTIEKFDEDVADEVDNYLGLIDGYYSRMNNRAEREIESRKQYYESVRHGYYHNRRNMFHNEKLQDIVTNVYEKNKIIRYKNRLIQQVDPIFLDADNSSFFGFRSHFYAPRKWFCGRYYDTFAFDIVVIWLFSILCYVLLYFDVLKKTIDWAGSLNFDALFGKVKSLFKRKVEDPSKTKLKIVEQPAKAAEEKAAVETKEE